MPSAVKAFFKKGRGSSPARDTPSSKSSDHGSVPTNAVNRIENMQVKTRDSTSFDWAVGSFSKYAPNKKLHSQKVTAGGCRWYLDCFPRGYLVPNWTSIYLNAADVGEAGEQWRCQVTFTLAIVHQKTKEPIVSATFSKLFSRQAPSWGKNNFVDVNDIFQSDKSVYDDDTVLFHCDITAVNSIGHELEDAGTVANGRHRFVWRVHNFESVQSRLQTGQKLSSNEFTAGKNAWFLDLYPSGYRHPEHASLYLHAGAIGSSSSNAAIRVPFTLGLYDYLNQQFEPQANLLQTFSSSVRCWGKHNFKRLEDILNSDRDRYLDRDTIVFCVDIAITIDKPCQVQMFLWFPRHAARHCAKCLSALGLKKNKRQCHQCGGVFCASCCASERQIPDLGYEYPVRVCFWCAAALDDTAEERTLYGRSSRWISADDSRGSMRSNREEVGVQALGGLWYPDLLVTNCSNRSCSKSFNVFTRKHHCRSCGEVLCSSCVRATIRLPELGIGVPVRVCDACAKARGSTEPVLISASPQVNVRTTDAVPEQRRKMLEKRAREQERERILASVPKKHLGKARVYCPWLFSTNDDGADSSDEGARSEPDTRKRASKADAKRRTQQPSSNPYVPPPDEMTYQTSDSEDERQERKRIKERKREAREEEESRLGNVKGLKALLGGSGDSKKKGRRGAPPQGSYSSKSSRKSRGRRRDASSSDSD